jgi:hypothetical protein
VRREDVPEARGEPVKHVLEARESRPRLRGLAQPIANHARRVVPQQRRRCERRLRQRRSPRRPDQLDDPRFRVLDFDQQPVAVVRKMHAGPVFRIAAFAEGFVGGPPAEPEAYVDCQCGARYHKKCSETVVNCIDCSRTLVTNVLYPEVSETFSG